MVFMKILNNFGFYQKYTIIVALVIIIIVMIVLFFTLSRKNPNWRLPYQKCPDYWVEASDNSGGCYNIKGLGTCFSTTSLNSNKNYSMNFDTENLNTDCLKQKWANGCNISWDGITYGYGKLSPCEKNNR